jgi:anthranilate/para-aminobenzoate synthase component II
MLNSTKIYIVDFDDSFTYNIASELFPLISKIEVINYKDFFSNDSLLLLIENNNYPFAIILGPGPGTPIQYQKYFSLIKKFKKNKNIFLMGICLGHQIFSLIDGLIIKSSKNPKHGIQEDISFDDKIVKVQRYNSLAVYETKTSLKEIQIRTWDRGISYQFHPESIGTENSLRFFKELLDFIN